MKKFFSIFVFLTAFLMHNFLFAENQEIKNKLDNIIKDIKEIKKSTKEEHPWPKFDVLFSWGQRDKKHYKGALLSHDLNSKGTSRIGIRFYSCGKEKWTETDDFNETIKMDELEDPIEITGTTIIKNKERCFGFDPEIDIVPHTFFSLFPIRYESKNKFWEFGGFFGIASSLTFKYRDSKAELKDLKFKSGESEGEVLNRVTSPTYPSDLDIRVEPFWVLGIDLVAGKYLAIRPALETKSVTDVTHFNYRVELGLHF